MFRVARGNLFPFVPFFMSAEKGPKKVRVGNVLVKVYRVKHATAASGWAYVVAHSQAGMRKLSKFATPAEALAEAQLKAEPQRMTPTVL